MQRKKQTAQRLLRVYTPHKIHHQSAVKCTTASKTRQCLTPAGSDDHPLAGLRVGDGSVVMDESGIEGHAIHIQSHGRELDAEGEMMPLAVTHLLDRDNIEVI